MEYNIYMSNILSEGFSSRKNLTIYIVCCVGRVEIQIEIQKGRVLPIRIVWSNVSSIGRSSERNKDL